jgi:Methyltransferase domain
VCDPHRLKSRSKNDAKPNTTGAVSSSSLPPPPPCLVYSIGSNGDPSFEQSVRQEIGPHCEIHVFDMDNYSRKVMKAVPHNAYYHKWGIAKENKFRPDNRGRIYKTLNQTMYELGHLNTPIDIFKIDCEGCEWQIYPDFFLPGIDLRQILIELHANNIQISKNGGTVLMPETPDFFKMMERNYVIFHKEPNIQWSVGAAAIEYCFLKLHPAFFEGIGVV